MKKILTILIALFVTASGFGQGVLKGKITNDENKSPLIGASVLVNGTTIGTITNLDGNFELKNVPAGFQVLSVSYVGFSSKEVPVEVKSGMNELGSIPLLVDAYTIDNVVIVGRGVIDVAKDRQTPVAVSTIPQIEIVQKSGNLEFPEVMKNTPSVYVASQAGGYGDSRINIRGFTQENLALLFNGQPVNGMEDGKVYWSNWQGLSDIANAVQIQRGLGSSKLAISSVGATINVVTKATDKEQGGRVSYLYGNDNYMKAVASYSTGLSESGWGLSFLLSHWQGDGYNDGTQGQGQTYFVSLGYKPNDKHSFNFSATGAPQWHYQNYTKKLSQFDLDGDGDITNTEQRYNSNWGMLDGNVYSWRKNFYHKPVANLNWDWDINKKVNLSTVIYASIGQGGGTGPYGKSSTYNVYDGDQLDFDAIFANNSGIEKDENGFVVGEYGKGTLRRASMNLHNWYGAVSNLNYDLNENLSLNFGFDLRTYYGRHFRLVDDLLGLDGYWDNNYGATGYSQIYPGGQLYTQEYGSSPYMSWTNRNNGNIDAKLDYFNNERITYGGLFGQLEYKTDKLSTFVQGALSNQNYQRFDYHTYALPSDQVSEKLQFMGYNIKGGANFNINENHNVFANAGYYSRQPFFDDLFLNYSNLVNEDVGNEGLLGLELGYGLRTDMVDLDLNAYYTKWTNRQIRQGGDFDGDGESDDIALFENVGENHMGLELEFTVKPMDGLDIGGFASLGSWDYAGNVTAYIYDEDRNPIGNTDNILYLDGVKVGDAAQTTFGLLAKYKIMDGLTIDADWRLYDKLYAAINPSAFTSEVNNGSLELPSFNLLDAGITYRYLLKNYDSIILRANFNNVLNKQFISQSDTNIFAEEGDDVWNGVNMNNRVYFGNGFTWNVSIGYKF
jgi:iron complex outermembrane receptor protein